MRRFLKFAALGLALFAFTLNAQKSYSADYAVTPPFFDNIGEILTTLGLTHDQIQETDLQNLALLNTYRAVFINCSGTIDSNLTPIAISALQQYVMNGGMVYASDWAYIVVANAFPGFIEFYPSPKIAPSVFNVEASIENAGMKDYLGASSVEIHFNLSAWVPIQSVKPTKTEVFLKGVDGNEYTTGKPILAKFDYGEGSVIYTAFHNEDGLSAPAMKALEYMVLLSALSKTANDLAKYFRDQGFIVTKENLDILPQGEEKDYTYELLPGQEVEMGFGLAWKNNATFQLNVAPPAPAMGQSGGSATSPFHVEITPAPSGTYDYTVSPVVATGNHPYVVMTARRTLAFDQVASVKVYPNPFRSDEHTVVIFDGLTEQATIKIYSISGQLIKTIHKNDSSGTAFWETDNDTGEWVASGLYIYTAEGTAGSKKRGKLAIIR